jgi:hypothetical protein
MEITSRNILSAELLLKVSDADPDGLIRWECRKQLGKDRPRAADTLVGDECLCILKPACMSEQASELQKKQIKRVKPSISHSSFREIRGRAYQVSLRSSSSMPMLMTPRTMAWATATEPLFSQSSAHLIHCSLLIST